MRFDFIRPKRVAVACLISAALGALLWQLIFGSWASGALIGLLSPLMGAVGALLFDTPGHQP